MTLSLDDQAALHRYVFQVETPENGGHVSTFRAALHDARKFGGRNLETGIVEGEATAVWSSVLLYLVLMEQAGKVICPAPDRLTKGSDLRDTLRRFASGLDEDDLDVLYALRNAFAHEFAMANPNAKDPSLNHRFQFALAGDPRVVIYNGHWNGEFGSKSVGGPTEVNLTALAVMVERVVDDIEARCRAGELLLVDGVDPEMVPVRWTFRTISHH